MDVIQTSLALFQPPLIDNGILHENWIEYNPIGSISESPGLIEFSIPGTSMDYINLRKSRLSLQYKITKENGDPIIYEVSGLNVPTDNCDQVAPINFPLNTFFRQVDLSLNQKVVSSEISVNFPFKNILDLLLTSSSDMLENTKNTKKKKPGRKSSSRKPSKKSRKATTSRRM